MALLALGQRIRRLGRLGGIRPGGGGGARKHAQGAVDFADQAIERPARRPSAEAELEVDIWILLESRATLSAGGVLRQPLYATGMIAF